MAYAEVQLLAIISLIVKFVFCLMHRKFLPISKKAFILWGFFVISSLFYTGCGNFFSRKPTEIESREILNELERIKDNPFIANPMPELYKSEPKIVQVSDGFRIFYFAKQLNPNDLMKILSEQTKYNISINQATNQMIIQCPDEAQALKVLEFLKMTDVPPIQINIDCIVLERFADVTMDWETTILMQNFLGEGVTFGEGKYPNPAFPGASLRESKRSEFGLDVGYWHNKGVEGHQFRAAVDMLISRGYLKILMNPALETVNGKTATIISKEFAPIEKIVTTQNTQPYSLTEYQWVSDTLTVTPFVYADGSIGLTTEIIIGSRSKPEGVVQQSIITERSTKVAENRIKPGDSLVIGGIRKSEQRSVIRGIPFFEDLPIIGVLFSSKDYEEKGTEIIFILTPSISGNGIKNATMTEDLRQKFKSPELDPGVQSIITDPFSGGIYTEHVEQKAKEAEYQRITAEIQKSRAEEEIGLLQEELQSAAEKAKQEEEKARQATLEAQESLKNANEATERMKLEQQNVQKALQEGQATKAQAEQALKDLQAAEEARKQAEKAAADAQQRETEAAQKQALAEKAAADAQQRETEAAQKQAEKAAAEAAAKAQAEKEALEAQQRAAEEAQRQAQAAEAARVQAEKDAQEAQQRAAEEAQKQAQPQENAADPNKI